MTCPYCETKFTQALANAAEIPDLAPVLCDTCLHVSLLVEGKIRSISDDELAAIKMSDAWRDVLKPAMKIILADKARKANAAYRN